MSAVYKSVSKTRRLELEAAAASQLIVQVWSVEHSQFLLPGLLLRLQLPLTLLTLIGRRASVLSDVYVSLRAIN